MNRCWVKFILGAAVENVHYCERVGSCMLLWIGRILSMLVAGLAFVNGIFSLLESFSLQGSSKTVLMLNGLIGLAFALMICFGWP